MSEYIGVGRYVARDINKFLAINSGREVNVENRGTLP